MGSKSRISKYVIPILQNIIDSNDITTYVEPFCGGCNIIDKIRCDFKIANDKQLYLIELLKNVIEDHILIHWLYLLFHKKITMKLLHMMMCKIY